MLVGAGVGHEDTGQEFAKGESRQKRTLILADLGNEIIRLRKACQVIHMGHKAMLSTLREGITELEFPAAVENAHRLAGHEGIFFR